MFLALDTETGGIGLDKSLLEATFVSLDEGFNVHERLELKIKPNDLIYHVTAEALSINNINLVEHDKVAITEGKAGTLLYNFLKKQYLENKSEKLIPLGHNVKFDCVIIEEKLISSWDQFVSYRVIDTCVIAQFLRVIGKLPKDVECSLKGLRKHFGISLILPTGELHSASYDVDLSIEVFRNLIRIESGEG
jgi:DNA polymerase III alpha subunit (gram-positive type)